MLKVLSVSLDVVVNTRIASERPLQCEWVKRHSRRLNSPKVVLLQ